MSIKKHLLGAVTLALSLTFANGKEEPHITASNGTNLITNNSLNGWQIPNTGRWSISGGVILGDTKGKELSEPEWIYTSNKYADFVLSLDMKMTGVRANSGIYYRSKIVDYKGKYKAPSGYEFDASASGKLNASIGDYFGRGRKFRFAADQTAISKAFKIGEWNRMTVRADGKSIEYWINGTLVNSITDTSTPQNKEGVIGIQLHDKIDMKVEFRNVFVKKLNVTTNTKVSPTSLK